MEHWRDIARIARREWRHITGDSRLRSVVLIAPFVYAALFCCVYINHTVTDVPIAVLQLDYTRPARQFHSMLQTSPKLRIAYQARSIEELKDLMYAGKIDGAVVIPSDFSLRLKRGQDAFATAYVNASSMVSANTAAKALNEVIATFSAGVLMKSLMKRQGVRLDDAKRQFMPVKMDLRPMFNPSFNYSNFMIPGLLAAILQQVILLGLALSWTGEKEFGTLEELFSISRNPLVLIAGKALPYLAVNFLVAEVYLRVLFPLNDIPMEGAWWLAIPFTFLFVVTIVTWGMWVSGLCKTRLFATQVLMFVAMPSFVLSGFTWPQGAMPPWVQFLGRCLPLTYFANSFRNIYLAGAPLRFVWGDMAALAAFTALNLVLAYWVIGRLAKVPDSEPAPSYSLT